MSFILCLLKRNKDKDFTFTEQNSMFVIVTSHVCFKGDQFLDQPCPLILFSMQRCVRYSTLINMFCFTDNLELLDEFVGLYCLQQLVLQWPCC